MTWLRRNLGTIALVLGAWTVGHSIATYRERANTECAYHEGYDEGYRDRAHEPIQGLTVRDNPDGSQEIIPTRIEEDSPLWDCATMGNRKCGARDTPLDTRRHTAHRVKGSGRK